MSIKIMEKYDIYANGAYWGCWEATHLEAAIQDAVNEIGTDGNADGMSALTRATTTKAVATIYTNRLKRRLTPLELSAVASDQKVPNDFYDANMCLSAAFEIVFGKEPYSDDQDDTDILNAAMTISQAQIKKETRS